jgi:hypothetical protein
MHLDQLADHPKPAIPTWIGPVTSSRTIVRIPEGNLFSGVLASFIYPHTLAVPGNLAARIDWGDGKTSAGGIAFHPDTNRLEVCLSR